MTILAIYNADPGFPAKDQAAGAARVQVGGLLVDYTGAVPVQADVDAFFAPALAVAARTQAFQADAGYQTLLAQLRAATPAQVTNYINTNVVDLPTARTMLAKLALIVALLANGG